MMINFDRMVIPNKLSELLRRVVEDMRTVRRRDHVEFDMETWADWNGSQCTVCAAGAFVLAECFPEGIDVEDEDEGLNVSEMITEEGNHNEIMELIDCFRIGDTYDAVLHYSIPSEVERELNRIFTTIEDAEDYDECDYQDVVRWFNTASKYLASKGY